MLCAQEQGMAFVFGVQLLTRMNSIGIVTFQVCSWWVFKILLSDFQLFQGVQTYTFSRSR